MARYIDIDKVKPDCISTKGGVAVSQSQLANQSTADVIEREKIDKAIEELCEKVENRGFLSCASNYIQENIREIFRRNIGE